MRWGRSALVHPHPPSSPWQVLADDNMRAKYDQHGAAGVDGQSFMDAGAL